MQSLFRTFADAPLRLLLDALLASFALAILFLLPLSCRSEFAHQNYASARQASNGDTQRSIQPPLFPDDLGLVVQGEVKNLKLVTSMLTRFVQKHDFDPLTQRLANWCAEQTGTVDLEAIGLKDSSFLTAAYLKQQVIVAFRAPDENTVMDTLTEWQRKRSMQVASWNFQGHSYWYVATGDPRLSGLVLSLVHDPNGIPWVFFSISPALASSHPAKQREHLELFSSQLHQWSLRQKEGSPLWGDRYQRSDVPLPFSELLVASLRPGRLIQDLGLQLSHHPWVSPTNQNQGETLLQAAFDQLGELALSLRFDSPRQKIIGELRRRHVNQADQTSDNTKPASDGKLSATAEITLPKQGAPPLSTLAPIGTLGIVHLAADPSSFFRFFTAVLSPLQKSKSDAFLARVNTDFSFDLKRFFNNLTGHFIVTLYGFDPNRLNPDSPSYLLDQLTLSAWTKSILIPFRDNRLMIEFLDLCTIFYPNHFSRNGHGIHDLEFVWHDKGVASWGVVVKKHALIYVDSWKAYHRAKVYDGNSVAFSLHRYPDDFLRKLTSIERRFQKNDHDASLYLNVRYLRSILQNTRYAALERWLRPFSSFTFVNAQESPDSTVLSFEAELSDSLSPLIDRKTDQLSPARFFVPDIYYLNHPPLNTNNPELIKKAYINGSP